MKTKALDISTGQLIDIEEPDVVVNDEENLIWLRTRRNEMLAESDWMANSDVTMSDAWKTYRQALRDITDSATSLDDVTWPTKPE
jgi:gluconate kinase